MDVYFRKATSADLTKIAEFLDRHLRKDWFMPRSRIESAIASASSRCFLAYHDQLLVGIALAGGKRQTLYNLLVHPEFRAKGIGAQLVMKADPMRIRVKTNMSSGDPSGFYRKLGYCAFHRDARRNHITIYERPPKAGEQLTLDHMLHFPGLLDAPKQSATDHIGPSRAKYQKSRLTLRTLRLSTGIPPVAVLDANVFIGLQQVLYPSHPLAQLHRRALSGRVQIYVTEELPTELRRDKNDERRDRQLSELAKFPLIPPVTDAGLSRTVERLLKVIFPQANPHSRHLQNMLSDCRQLAFAIEANASHFVTYDKDILKRRLVIKVKFGLDVVTPEGFLAALEIQARPAGVGPLVRPHLDIRDGTKADLEVVGAAIAANGESLHLFKDRMSIHRDTLFKLLEVDEDIAAVAVANGCGAEVCYLDLLWVAPKYRRRGLGQHLLQHVVNTLMATHTGKVVVDVPAELKYMPVFLERFGFRMEGMAAHPSLERVAARFSRSFIYKLVTSETWDDFVRYFLHTILVLRSTEEPGTWMPAIHAGPDPDPLSVEATCTTQGAQLLVRNLSTGRLTEAWDTYQLEADFAPLQIAFHSRHAVFIPIRPQWADALFEYCDPQLRFLRPKDKRKLRVDNVYYKAGRNAGAITRGTPLLWYVSKHGRSFPGGIVACAKVISSEIGHATDLFEKYGDLGIYSKEAVISAGKSTGGLVQAIRFGQVEAFTDPVRLPDIRRLLGFNSIPITARAVPFTRYLAVRKLAGLNDI